MKYIVTVNRLRRLTEETKVVVDVPDDEEYPLDSAQQLAIDTIDGGSATNQVEECEDEHGNVTKLPVAKAPVAAKWKIIDDGAKDLIHTDFEVKTVRKFKSSTSK